MVRTRHAPGADPHWWVAFCAYSHPYRARDYAARLLSRLIDRHPFVIYAWPVTGSSSPSVGLRVNSELRGQNLRLPLLWRLKMPLGKAIGVWQFQFAAQVETRKGRIKNDR